MICTECKAEVSEREIQAVGGVEAKRTARAYPHSESSTIWLMFTRLHGLETVRLVGNKFERVDHDDDAIRELAPLRFHVRHETHGHSNPGVIGGTYLVTTPCGPLRERTPDEASARSYQDQLETLLGAKL